MKSHLVLAAAAAGMMFAASASANPNIVYGDPIINVDVDVQTETGPVYNQAQQKSGGKAPDKNKSNFQDVITTTTTTTTTTEKAFNTQSEKFVPGQDKTDVDVDVETESSKEKVH